MRATSIVFLACSWLAGVLLPCVPMGGALLSCALLGGGAFGQTRPPPAAQAPPRGEAELGSPEAAFAGGPIKLSKGAAGLLRAHYQGDKVPIVPQPFRGRLDTALAARDWGRIETIKKELAATYGLVAVLAWEQSRFIGTGGVGIAELHALDVAATGSTGLSETAVMLWLYSVAATMTDGHKCGDAAAKDAHLDKLRGPVFEPVLKLLRGLADDRLGAMRDIALRLESVLAADRTDDTMCRTGTAKPEVKADPLWRAQAVATRAMLPRHMVALIAVMRPKIAAKPEPSTAKPGVTKPVPPKPAQVPVVAKPAGPVAPSSVVPSGAPPGSLSVFSPAAPASAGIGAAAAALLAPLGLPGAGALERPGAFIGGPVGAPVAGGLTIPLPFDGAKPDTAAAPAAVPGVPRPPGTASPPIAAPLALPTTPAMAVPPAAPIPSALPPGAASSTPPVDTAVSPAPPSPPAAAPPSVPRP